ncbi:MAG: hypothetical protein AAF585_25680 [Verrucomicrobiota bacterium]
MDTAAIIQGYIEHVLEEGSAPMSVYAFTKKLDLSEREFFEHFGSLEALEGQIWATDVEETLRSVQSSDDWNGFGAEQKLLAFDFAFCDRILDRRSFYLARFPRRRKGQTPGGSLKEMGRVFTAFAEGLVQDGSGSGEIACRGALTRTYPHGLFLHLLSVIEFNLADDSKGFERTDAYIEKSVKLAFDLIGSQALDSAFDLVRFLTGKVRRHNPAAADER